MEKMNYCRIVQCVFVQCVFVIYATYFIAIGIYATYFIAIGIYATYFIAIGIYATYFIAIGIYATYFIAIGIYATYFIAIGNLYVTSGLSKALHKYFVVAPSSAITSPSTSPIPSAYKKNKSLWNIGDLSSEVFDIIGFM